MRKFVKYCLAVKSNTKCGLSKKYLIILKNTFVFRKTADENRWQDQKQRKICNTWSIKNTCGKKIVYGDVRQMIDPKIGLKHAHVKNM